MTTDRWVVLGLSHPRAGWFSTLARWSTTAAIPVDFVKCVSPDEARARLSSGRAFSAVLIGGDVAGMDRDLIETARDAGAAAVVVGPVTDREWDDLGVAAVLPADFDRTALLSVLRECSRPIPRVAALPPSVPADNESAWRGRLIAVTGPGGTGASVTAMAVAQAFADEPSNNSMVLLADLALDADQGMLHDARQVMPGIQELVETHRVGRAPIEEVRSLAFEAAGRGYHLMLGLRRHRDWTAVRPHAFLSALDGLMRSYRFVVADTDSDIEGEELTGSIDVEDRNTMARATLMRADVVVVVGVPDTKGLHALSRTLRLAVSAGVPPERVVAVLTHAPRSPRQRAASVRALASLLGTDEAAAGIGNPVFLPHRSDVEASIRDGIRLPSQLGHTLHAELTRRLDEVPRRETGSGGIEPAEPAPITPGSLGHWTEEVG